MNSDAHSSWLFLVPVPLHLVLAIAAVGLLGNGCASADVSFQQNRPAIFVESPALHIVARGKELVAADAVAAAAGAKSVQTFWCVGASMEPLFATHTAIVVAPVEFSSLHKGMIVLYRDGDGFGAAHVLMENQPDGWTARGVNRDEEDSTLVTAANLIGVVTQAFAATEPAGRKAFVAAFAPQNLVLPRALALTKLVAYQFPAH